MNAETITECKYLHHFLVMIGYVLSYSCPQLDGERVRRSAVLCVEGGGGGDRRSGICGIFGILVLWDYLRLVVFVGQFLSPTGPSAHGVMYCSITCRIVADELDLALLHRRIGSISVVTMHGFDTLPFLRSRVSVFLSCPRWRTGIVACSPTKIGVFLGPYGRKSCASYLHSLDLSYLPFYLFFYLLLQLLGILSTQRRSFLDTATLFSVRPILVTLAKENLLLSTCRMMSFSRSLIPSTRSCPASSRSTARLQTLTPMSILILASCSGITDSLSSSTTLSSSAFLVRSADCVSSTGTVRLAFLLSVPSPSRRSGFRLRLASKMESDL